MSESRNREGARNLAIKVRSAMSMNPSADEVFSVIEEALKNIAEAIELLADAGEEHENSHE